jgi:hypothetical protein
MGERQMLPRQTNNTDADFVLLAGVVAVGEEGFEAVASERVVGMVVISSLVS